MPGHRCGRSCHGKKRELVVYERSKENYGKGELLADREETSWND